jgi:hypothetical protein
MNRRTSHSRPSAGRRYAHRGRREQARVRCRLHGSDPRRRLALSKTARTTCSRRSGRVRSPLTDLAPSLWALQSQPLSSEPSARAARALHRTERIARDRRLATPCRRPRRTSSAAPSIATRRTRTDPSGWGVPEQRIITGCASAIGPLSGWVVSVNGGCRAVWRRARGGWRRRPFRTRCAGAPAQCRPRCAVR